MTIEAKEERANMMSHIKVDSRAVAVHELHVDDGDRLVVMCHAAPGSGCFDPDPDVTRSREITLIGVDRPGYGKSDPVPEGSWATVASAADEVAAVIDELGAKSVGVAGWSAGGRVALAVAARRPDLVDRVVVIATPAPDDQVPWYPAEVRDAIEALRGAPPDVVHAAFEAQLREGVPRDYESDEALAFLGASPADEKALGRAGARARLAAMLDAAFTQGVTGLARDMAGYCLQPWGFEPQDVKAKTLLLYASRDPVAAQGHASWWQKQLRGSRVEMAPGASHLSVIPRWKRALSHLAPGTLRRT